MDLERCLSLLKNAQSDNERMASLLLVTKIVKSGEIGEEGRRRVFDAVGFSFINRLLATRQVPEGCSENPYHRIATTILACFCTDPQLAVHPQITSKIPLFNEFILHSSSGGGEGSVLVDDALQCLQAIGATPTGLQHLMRYNSLDPLARCFLKQGEGSQRAKELLLCILSQRDFVVQHTASVEGMVTILAEEFHRNQDALKFQLSEVLYFVLSLVGELLSSGGVSWLKHVTAGLEDILSSRIGTPQRNGAFQLSALLCHLFGVNWTFSVDAVDKKQGTFFKLLVNLVGVETRLALEDQEVTDVVKNSSLVSACFVVLEHAVVHVARLAEKTEQEGSRSSPLTQEDLLQLHTTLTESFTFIIHFIQSLERAHPDNPSLLHEPVTLAAIRILCAWLAEESLALPPDFYRLLPFLVEVCGSSVNKHACSSESADKSPPEDLLKFLLPGLSHLTAEDRPRRILLKANLQRVLYEYLQYLCSNYHSATELEGRLTLCCGVLLNVCICESALVKQDEVFTSVASTLVKLMAEGLGENALLTLNAVLLFLVVTRRQGIDKVSSGIGSALAPTWHAVMELLLQTLKSCPHVSRAACGVGPGSYSRWNEVSELWFLSMQELTAIANSAEEVKHVAAETHVIRGFTEILGGIGDKRGSDELQAIAAALCSLMQALAAKD